MIMIGDDSTPDIKNSVILNGQSSVEEILISKIAAQRMKTPNLGETRKIIFKNKNNSGTINEYGLTDKNELKQLRNRENQTVTMRAKTIKLENLPTDPTENQSSFDSQGTLSSLRRIKKVRMHPAKIVGNLPKTQTNRML